jgi:hypothetical protein
MMPWHCQSVTCSCRNVLIIFHHQLALYCPEQGPNDGTFKNRCASSSVYCVRQTDHTHIDCAAILAGVDLEQDCRSASGGSGKFRRRQLCRRVCPGPDRPPGTRLVLQLEGTESGANFVVLRG